MTKKIRSYQHKCFVLTVYAIDHSVESKRKRKWRRSSKYFGELHLLPDVHENDNKMRLLASMESSSMRMLRRSLFGEAWQMLYDFAVFFGDKSFQTTYLKNRIKKHEKWVVQASFDFVNTSCAKAKKSMVYNSAVLRKLQKRLEAL